MNDSLHQPTACSSLGRLLHTAATIPPRTLGGLVFPGFQALSLWGPLEVLGDCAPSIQPLIVAENRSVPSAQGPRVHSDTSLEDAPRFDLLLVPGGHISEARKDRRLLEWLQSRSSDAETVMAIGSGIDLLAATGHLDGRRAVTNQSFFTSTQRTSTVRWLEHTEWTTDGRYVTCSRARPAVDMALGVVAHFLGNQPAEQLAAHL